MFSASPATVKWLLDNFETADGVSLPRARMYDHYMIHSQQNNQEPVNAASFGKLVRSVFVGLKTRRLGTRGNSKYHYYGIKIKENSPLLAIQNDPDFASRVERITPRPTRKEREKNKAIETQLAKGNTRPTHSELTLSLSEYLSTWVTRVKLCPSFRRRTRRLSSSPAGWMKKISNCSRRRIESTARGLLTLYYVYRLAQP